MLLANASVQPSYELATQDRDAILSFAQSVNQQHHGPPQPELAYAADRALNAKSRLLAGVSETEAKERVLVDMHAKMSESVRLYNRLLESQIEQRRNTPLQSAQPVNEVPYYQQYVPRYNTASVAPPQPAPIPALPFSAPPLEDRQQLAPSAPPTIIPQQQQQSTDTQKQMQSQPISPAHNGFPNGYMQHYQQMPSQSQYQTQVPKQQPQPQPQQQQQQAKYNALAGLPSAPSGLVYSPVQHEQPQQQQQQPQQQQEAMLIEL